MKDGIGRAGVFYLISVILLTFYGIEVCPFLESLTTMALFATILAFFALGMPVRIFLFTLLRKREERKPDVLNLNRPWQHLLYDLFIWISIGVFITVWNTFRYDFPAESGLKIVLGCMTLGIFSATSLALAEEHRLIYMLTHGEKKRRKTTGTFFSVATKFLIFIVTALFVIALVIILLMVKDAQYALNNPQVEIHVLIMEISREILFVFVLLLGSSFLVAHQYSRNLRLILKLQLQAFEAVRDGNYDVTVPVVSSDEFSEIASHTNKMIVGLQEKERIKTAFGKYHSPAMADAILHGEQETKLGGRETEVVVLFTDLRNFTPLSERFSPFEVVQILNEYFTMIVKAVNRNHGVVDKYIGDAAMAVYGLDNAQYMCDAAVKTALEIREGLKALNDNFQKRNLSPVENGIGIHVGRVIAGNIGSEERLEYTVIGDTVNTAARLETLTRKLTSPIAISEAAYTHLQSSMKSVLSYLGDYNLKGKSEKVAVYGVTEE